MKVIIKTKEFFQIVKGAAGQVSTDPDKPVMSQALLVAGKETLTLLAYSNEMNFYQATIPALVGQAGRIAFPVVEMSGYLGGLGEDEIQLSMAGKQVRVRRGTSESGQFVPGGGEVFIDQPDLSDFPDEKPAGVLGELFSVESFQLKQALDGVVFAASKEEVRPGLTCIRLTASGSGERCSLRLGAASNVSMAMFDVPVESMDELNGSYLLPSAATKRLAALLPEAEGERVAVWASPNLSTLYFKYESKEDDHKTLTVGIRTIMVTPIDLERIFETVKKSPVSMVLNRVELVKSLRRVLAFTREESNQIVIMTIDPLPPKAGEPPSPSAKVTLYGRTDQRFETQEVMRAISYSGTEQIEIGLAVERMLEILAHFDGVTVELLLDNGQRPVLIRSVINKESQVCILMPIHFTKPPEKTRISQAA